MTDRRKPAAEKRPKKDPAPKRGDTRTVVATASAVPAAGEAVATGRARSERETLAGPDPRPVPPKPREPKDGHGKPS